MIYICTPNGNTPYKLAFFYNFKFNLITIIINHGINKISQRIHPKIGKNVFLADNATVVGDVEMGDDCSVWFNAVLRGDVNSIRIGNKVNIQDGSVLHTLYQKSTIEIGDNVSVGHNVTIHGAKIEDNVLVGMGATILDHAVIGSNSIIAANSLILSGTKVEPNSVYAGVPAKKVKDIEPEQTSEMINKIANNYLMYSGWYKEE
ncbi:gamma carbonic anhydrase family protein [Marinilabilia salmonicolor]|uniref:gamma carbonic anhydrase family protein n=1 Tax=Marinilabilia salmonicolor TaxID=989 RepID=UPI000AA84B89|nr:gamma carbonic anhydrase family protein [Marinilabilia salmonicolor]